MADDAASTLRGLAALRRRRPILTTAFALAATLTFIFALKAAVHFTYWSEHRLRPVASWMSPNYIARVWKLDREKVHEAFGTTTKIENNMPLARLAIERGKSPQMFVETAQELITDKHGDPPS